jgi:hypothetical protein
MVNTAMLLGAAGFFDLMGHQDELAEVKSMMRHYGLMDASVH